MTWDDSVQIGSEMLDQLDGLFAWDNGCVSSGIYDEALRQRLQPIVANFSETSKLKGAQQLYGTPTRYKQGYRNEDVELFLAWLNNGLQL